MVAYDLHPAGPIHGTSVNHWCGCGYLFAWLVSLCHQHHVPASVSDTITSINTDASYGINVDVSYYCSYASAGQVVAGIPCLLRDRMFSCTRIRGGPLMGPHWFNTPSQETS